MTKDNKISDYRSKVVGRIINVEWLINAIILNTISMGELKLSGTFFICNRQAGTSAIRAELRENNERDTANPVRGPVGQRNTHRCEISNPISLIKCFDGN
ncbi:MAG TPA: hypothetical protein VMW72_01735 [Sedimentisphaerales bacterium]|nr:hypothetical protein [Sedimentisphaerales bacterium]